MEDSKSSESERLVSFVIPTFEEDDIAWSLDVLGAHLLKSTGSRFEILVVDDSPARYKAAIRDYVESRRPVHGRRLIVHPIDGRKRGKGDAIRVGAFASRGSVVFTMDADLPVPLAWIDTFLELIDVEGFDVVIGERPLTRNVKEPVRWILSRILFVTQRVVIFEGTRFHDTQCGFKAFRGGLIRDLAATQIVCGGMYDIEYLYAADRRRATIARVPVVPNAEWRPSKIRVLRASLTDPIDLVRVKLSGLGGRYDKESSSEDGTTRGDLDGRYDEE
jgi:dolichyl-phosphate beta-glucosyltransferase